jgi:hypothetical protein
MNPSGVFHPKLYFFEYESGDWECITGSPNFTHGAFTSNTEVAVLFGNQDVNAAVAHDEIIKSLDEVLLLGKYLSEKELAAYRSIWNRQQRRLSPLSGSYAQLCKDSKPKRSPLEVPLFMADWAEYFNSVRVHSQKTVKQLSRKLLVTLPVALLEARC